MEHEIVSFVLQDANVLWRPRLPRRPGRLGGDAIGVIDLEDPPGRLKVLCESHCFEDALVHIGADHTRAPPRALRRWIGQDRGDRRSEDRQRMAEPVGGEECRAADRGFDAGGDGFGEIDDVLVVRLTERRHPSELRASGLTVD